MIYTVGHVGSNDAVMAAIARHGMPISVVADDSSFPELFELLRAERELRGATVIAWRNLREIYGVLRRREMLALLVDWGYRADGIPVRLFDAWTTLPAGPATLAAKTGSLILPVTIRRQPDDTFKLSWAEPIEVTSSDPARAPARDPGDRRRARGHHRRGAGAVVQLQADLAGDGRGERRARAAGEGHAGRSPGPGPGHARGSRDAPGERPRPRGSGRRP